MPSEIRMSYERDLHVTQVSVPGREAGRCIACGSTAERDTLTEAWWHLEPKQCSDPDAEFCYERDFESLHPLFLNMREVEKASALMSAQLDELKTYSDKKWEELRENRDRHLRRMKIMLAMYIVALLLFIASYVVAHV